MDNNKDISRTTRKTGPGADGERERREMDTDGFADRAMPSSSHVTRRVPEHVEIYGKKNCDRGGAVQPKPVDVNKDDRIDEGDESLLECDEQGLSEELATPDVGSRMVMGHTGGCVVSDGDSPSSRGQPARDIRSTGASPSRSALPKDVESVKRNNSTETAVTNRRGSSLTASPGPIELIGGYVQLMPLMLHALDRLRRGRLRRRSPLRFTPGKQRIHILAQSHFFFFFPTWIFFSCSFLCSETEGIFIFYFSRIPLLSLLTRADRARNPRSRSEVWSCMDAAALESWYRSHSHPDAASGPPPPTSSSLARVDQRLLVAQSRVGSAGEKLSAGQPARVAAAAADDADAAGRQEQQLEIITRTSRKSTKKTSCSSSHQYLLVYSSSDFTKPAVPTPLRRASFRRDTAEDVVYAAVRRVQNFTRAEFDAFGDALSTQRWVAVDQLSEAASEVRGGGDV